MDGQDSTPSRARSSARRDDLSPAARNNNAGEGPSGATRDVRSPQRERSSTNQIDRSVNAQRERASTNLSLMPTIELRPNSSELRRRAVGRNSNQINRIDTTGGRTGFSLAGPEESTQLRTAHENFVQPGYGELNPSYEQPANAVPVWSLAKPLPRVVRPGMVPTASELNERREKAELPTENSQRLGLNVDPNDLEKGKIAPTPNPRKLSAQLKDSRAQREENFVNSLKRSGTISRISAGQVPSLVSRASVDERRRRRASTLPTQAPWSPVTAQPGSMPPWQEEVEAEGHGGINPDLAEGPPPSAGPRLSAEGTEQFPDAPVDVPKYPSEPLDPIPETASDVASLSTLRVEDDPVLSEDLKPITPEAYFEEEIHNNHTTWSVFRTHHREFFAEFLAVLVQISIGLNADVAVQIAGSRDNITTNLAWGFATMIAIYISGGISGAHLNPAISLVLWFYRGFPKRKLPEYFLAQTLGAFLACYITYGCYHASISNYLASNPVEGILDSFVTSQRYSYIDTATAFFNEFLGTAFLATAVLALGDDQNAPPGAGMNALIIGFVVCVLDIAFAQQTGAALNPSRDFGVRLAMLSLGYGRQLFTNPYWFYGPIAATILGAFIGALLYDVFIFTGGESPVNYSWTRTRRATRKGGRKWARRLKIKRDSVDGKDQF